MWLDRDVAQSDVVLAGATAAVGPTVVLLLLSRLPLGYVVSLVIYVVAIFAVTGLVPWLLARHRGDNLAAFGLHAKDKSRATGGLFLALPIAVLFLGLHLSAGGALIAGLTGRILDAGPVVGPVSVTDAVARGAASVVLAVGSWLLLTFQSNRGRDAFRANEIDVTEGLRTFGLALVGASLVLGLLRSVGSLGIGSALLAPVVGLVILLLADREIPPRIAVNRTMLITPAATVMVMAFFLGGGSIFNGGSLLATLHRGASGAILALVVAGLVAVGKTRLTILPIAVAALYPTCLSPILFSTLFGTSSVC